MKAAPVGLSSSSPSPLLLSTLISYISTMASVPVLRHAPLVRAVQSRALAMASSSSSSARATSDVAIPSVNKNNQESRVLLGMSEQDLQQLALEFGQQKYRGKQLHHLLYKRKVKEIQDFSHLPLAFRNELQEAGWNVGRSPIYKEVTAADGTVKGLPQELRKCNAHGRVIMMPKKLRKMIVAKDMLENSKDKSDVEFANMMGATLLIILKNQQGILVYATDRTSSTGPFPYAVSISEKRIIDAPVIRRKNWSLKVLEDRAYYLGESKASCKNLAHKGPDRLRSDSKPQQLFYYSFQ
ncbi:UNVERIFIED_CONTAM: putative dual-specificity RNA methyltransferase RlmN [Sesamum radiatum]|uniref:Dual-specificity RNA methyltransferase RlmN n=1 Tax=Sesamum radiatum TaxID=300843 RepID=A0AAW2K9U0_SESRA